MGKNILYIAEIVTKVGVYCVKKQLRKLKDEYNIDFVIANADGASGGFGLGQSHSIYLRKLGVDVITSGNFIYNKKDIHAHMAKAYHLLRPANLPYENPGRGWRTYSIGERDKKNNRQQSLVIINLIGQSALKYIHPVNPYSILPGIVERAKKDTDTIILDFHTAITAEKATMNLYADGQVSAVIGSGMRVQTSDARILQKGTAVISDAGRTGSIQSVGGFDPKGEIEQRMLGKPLRSAECWEGLEIQGVILNINNEGKSESITPFRRSVEPPENHAKEPAENTAHKSSA